MIEPNPDNIVWESGIDDDKFFVRVVREAPYEGRLTLRTKEGRLLLDKRVKLAFDAIFGPDVADLNDWKDEVLRIVDNTSAAPISRKETS